MRRFNWKIEFKPLKSEMKPVLYKKYFKINRKKLTANQVNRIKGIPALTPGDIKAVWQKLRFLSNSGLKHEDIIGELEKEVAYKCSERVVGY